MKRRLQATLAACAAAPYLTALFMLIIDLLLSSEPEVENPLGFLIAIPIGTFGLLYFGLPLLCVGSLLAFSLHVLKWEAWWPHILSGAVLGSCFGGWVLSEIFVRFPSLIVTGGLAGALCGWIYWRIATGGRTKAPLA
jgi:hypothetical protein